MGSAGTRRCGPRGGTCALPATNVTPRRAPPCLAPMRGREVRCWVARLEQRPYSFRGPFPSAAPRPAGVGVALGGRPVWLTDSECPDPHRVQTGRTGGTAPHPARPRPPPRLLGGVGPRSCNRGRSRPGPLTLPMASLLIPMWRAARGLQPLSPACLSWTQAQVCAACGGSNSPRDNWGETPKGHRGPCYSEVNTGKVPLPRPSPMSDAETLMHLLPLGSSCTGSFLQRWGPSTGGSCPSCPPGLMGGGGSQTSHCWAPLPLHHPFPAPCPDRGNLGDLSSHPLLAPTLPQRGGLLHGNLGTSPPTSRGR